MPDSNRPPTPHSDSANSSAPHHESSDSADLLTDEDSVEEFAPKPGRVLLKSFFAVIVCLIGFFILSIAGHGLVTVMFFPAERAILTEGKADVSEATNLEWQDYQPSAQYWAIGILIYTASAFLAGTLLARLAPLAPIGHSILLAALLFLNALQPNESAVFEKPSWVMALFTFTVPSAVLIGAWMFAPRENQDFSMESSD